MSGEKFRPASSSCQVSPSRSRNYRLNDPDAPFEQTNPKNTAPGSKRQVVTVEQVNQLFEKLKVEERRAVEHSEDGGKSESTTPPGSPGAGAVKPVVVRGVASKTVTTTTTAYITPKPLRKFSPALQKRLSTPRLARHPVTPKNRMIQEDEDDDPAAHITPSKEIQSSLDKAIDEQIAYDASLGKTFTPSGNRISDLLARKREWEEKERMGVGREGHS